MSPSKDTSHQMGRTERLQQLHVALWATISTWASFPAESISVAKQKAVVAFEQALERYAVAYMLGTTHVHEVVAASVKKTLEQLRVDQEIVVAHPKAPRSDRSDERFAADAITARLMIALEGSVGPNAPMRRTMDNGIPVLTPEGEGVFNNALASARDVVRMVAERNGDTMGITVGADRAWDTLRDDIQRLVDTVREEERAQCITEIELKIRRWGQPDGYIGKPTERKNDQDVLRTAIHLLYARNKARIREVGDRVDALVKARTPELQR